MKLKSVKHLQTLFILQKTILQNNKYSIFYDCTKSTHLNLLHNWRRKSLNDHGLNFTSNLSHYCPTIHIRYDYKS